MLLPAERSVRYTFLAAKTLPGLGALDHALPTVHDPEDALRHLYIERALGQAWNAGEADTVGDATVQALLAGFQQHIAKPADVETLLQAISPALHPEEHNAPG